MKRLSLKETKKESAIDNQGGMSPHNGIVHEPTQNNDEEMEERTSPRVVRHNFVVGGADENLMQTEAMLLNSQTA